MTRRILLFLLPLCLLIPGIRTLHAAPVETPQSDTVVADTVAKRTPFFKRFMNYFQNANVDKTLTQKFDFSIIGGPNYSSNTGLGLGIVAAGLYRIDRTDFTMPPSNASLFSNISTTGFFIIGVRGNNLFKADKHRLDYTLFFSYKPTYFWGVGWDAAEYNDRSEYTRLEAEVEANFSWRVARHTYVGVSVDYDYITGKKFERPDYLPAGQSTSYSNAGAGFFIMYDSRDVINNAYKGMYFKLDQRFYPEFFGNRSYFSTTEFYADYYHPVWKGAILAFDLHGEFNRGGNIPWAMMAQMGTPYRMRGYYQGRYRDNGILEIQAELRQKIWRRSGATVWVGAGNVFPDVRDFNGAHTLPNYGIGYRWEFKKRVNVRLDYGFGRQGQNGFIFNINEAF